MGSQAQTPIRETARRKRARPRWKLPSSTTAPDSTRGHDPRYLTSRILHVSCVCSWHCGQNSISFTKIGPQIGWRTPISCCPCPWAGSGPGRDSGKYKASGGLCVQRYIIYVGYAYISSCELQIERLAVPAGRHQRISGQTSDRCRLQLTSKIACARTRSGSHRLSHTRDEARVPGALPFRRHRMIVTGVQHPGRDVHGPCVGAYTSRNSHVDVPY